MANRLWTFGDSIFSRENKPLKLFFQGPGRLSEIVWVDNIMTPVLQAICFGGARGHPGPEFSLMPVGFNGPGLVESNGNQVIQAVTFLSPNVGGHDSNL